MESRIFLRRRVRPSRSRSFRPYSRPSEVTVRGMGTCRPCMCIYGMVIAHRVNVLVITSSAEMRTAVSAPVGQIMPGRSVIKMIPVRVYLIYTQVTYVVQGVDRVEKIVERDETCIFRI